MNGEEKLKSDPEVITRKSSSGTEPFLSQVEQNDVAATSSSIDNGAILLENERGTKEEKKVENPCASSIDLNEVTLDIMEGDCPSCTKDETALIGRNAFRPTLVAREYDKTKNKCTGPQLCQLSVPLSVPIETVTPTTIGSADSNIIPILQSDSSKNKKEEAEDSASTVTTNTNLDHIHEGDTIAIRIDPGTSTYQGHRVDNPQENRQERDGYESDIPILEEESSFSLTRIVRASMRRMRHFRLSGRGRQNNDTGRESTPPPSPLPASASDNPAFENSMDDNNNQDNDSAGSPANLNHQQHQQTFGLATVNSPTTNGIIVTSLMNVMNGSNPNDERTTVQLPPSNTTVNTTVSTEGSETMAGDRRLPYFITDSSNNEETLNAREQQVTSTIRSTPVNSSDTLSSSNREESEEHENPKPSRVWSRHCSSILSLLGCTLGLLNISRFALLSIDFGANFIIQFLILSFLFGIPLLMLQMSLGQYIGAGVIDMWKISPVFQGIGAALLFSQMAIGVYSIIGVAYLFTYFRDSFLVIQDQYKWGLCLPEYRDCPGYSNISVVVSEVQNIPNYFNDIVLQRINTTKLPAPDTLGSVKFPIAFNLGIIWIIIFVVLSKGLRSYGKVMYVAMILPIIGIIILSSKVLGLSAVSSFTMTTHAFSQTSWSDFFFSNLTWMAAAREVFFTWGLLGACIMQITSKNKLSHNLRRDAAVVIIITLTVLLISAFLANACLQQIESHRYYYTPSSFEIDHTARFLHTNPSASYIGFRPRRNAVHNTFLEGVRIIRESQDHQHFSGYQILRFATELFPALTALVGPNILSPFWVILFYLTLILFGIAQQLTIWHSVISGIISIDPVTMKSWETTIALFTCLLAFVIGLPMTTNSGIYVVYVLDSAIGCAWWIMILYVSQLVVVFIFRGNPYNAESVVNAFLNGRGKVSTILSPLLSFTWNIILPVALGVLAITSFRHGEFRKMFTYKDSEGYEGWKGWGHQVGTLIQVFPLVAVILVAFVQCYRYISYGPPDLFDRFILLYRPRVSHNNNTQRISPQPSPVTVPGLSNGNISTEPESDDPPPKYTPPPSYSTATGSRIAKILRRSMRRSMRRLQVFSQQHAEEVNNGNTQSASSSTLEPPPPDYSTVLFEMSQNSGDTNSASRNASSNNITPEAIAQLLRTSVRKGKNKQCIERNSQPYTRQLNSSTASSSVFSITTEMENPTCSQNPDTVINLGECSSSSVI